MRTRPRAGDVLPGTLDRMLGMLSVAAEELPDCPFYFQTDKLCSTVRTTVPKIDMIRLVDWFTIFPCVQRSQGARKQSEEPLGRPLHNVRH